MGLGTDDVAAPSSPAASDPGGGRSAAWDRTTIILLALLVPLAVATVVGLIVLWPSGTPPVTGIVQDDASYSTGRVLAAVEDECAGVNEDRRPDGEIPSSVPCTLVTVGVPDEDGLQVEVWAPSTVRAVDLDLGTEVVLAQYPATASEAELWVWHDYARSLPLALFAIAYAVVVVAVAGMRGLRALLGLGFAFGVLAVFMLPALLERRDAPAVALVGSMAIMFVVLYLAHGISRRTTTALLGTFAGLGVTALLGWLGASAARLTGITSEDDYRLAMLTGQVEGEGLRGIFLAGVVLAGLGVLNDVTITQAAAVWELRAVDPTASRRRLFAGGMRIGRDHIASTVYTIAFAYAGAALPVLLLIQVYRLPLMQTVTGGEFAEEIIRTAVGSIGLVLAIPLTTAIAALVVTAGPYRAARHRHAEATGHTHSHS